MGLIAGSSWLLLTVGKLMSQAEYHLGRLLREQCQHLPTGEGVQALQGCDTPKTQNLGCVEVYSPVPSSLSGRAAEGKDPFLVTVPLRGGGHPLVLPQSSLFQGGVQNGLEGLKADAELAPGVFEESTGDRVDGSCLG